MARMLPFVLIVVLLALGTGFLIGRGVGLGDSGPASAASADLAGTVRVIDGDTLDVGGSRVRLHGVDAPEKAQMCLDADGQAWACGGWATDEARARWDGEEAACEIIETDRYGRAVSRCAVGGADLGATLVGEGMALAYVEHSEDYLPQQRTAGAERVGLWQGSFQAPWDWRRNADAALTDVTPVGAQGEDWQINGHI